MITNANLVIYNHRYNPDTGTDEWLRSEIGPVSRYHQTKAELTSPTQGRSESRVSVGQAAIVRIPLKSARGYLPPGQWAGEGWTAQEGALLVDGVCAPARIGRPSDLDKAGISYMTVKGWADNRRGSPAVQHIKLVAV